MRRFLLSLFLALVLACVCCACTPTTPTQATETYALIIKSEGNPYNDYTAAGYREAIEAMGYTCLVSSPKHATAEAQIPLIQEMVNRKVNSISIAANDVDALQKVLQQAMSAGIVVTAMDSSTNAASRMTFVNQAGTADVAKVLVDAVYDITNGRGQWAILSATNQATNQNAWIDAMQLVLQDPKYKNMRLVDIVYGNDDARTSADVTLLLLEKYPNLKVICSPTAVGLPAAAQTIVDAESSVKVTGLGLPSDMAAYITGQPNDVCPYVYLWNPFDLGQLSAQTSMALVHREITGKAGESFLAGDMGEYTIVPCADGGTEVILAPPMRIDASNIHLLKSRF